jgi:hypothetical protein
LPPAIGRKQIWEATIIAATESPGVVAIPPFIYGGFLLVGAFLEFLFPTNVLPDRPQFILAAFIFVVSVIIALAAFELLPVVGPPGWRFSGFPMTAG